MRPRVLAPRSLPPLSFGDPELDIEPERVANDNLQPDAPLPQSPACPTLTFASLPPSAAENNQSLLLAYHVPSIIPEATPDPSFTAPADPSFASEPPLPRMTLTEFKPPPPTLETRITTSLEAALARLPSPPDDWESRVPLPVLIAVSLVLLWMELGMVIRSLRAVITAIVSIVA